MKTRTIGYIFIHCTATPANFTRQQIESIFKQKGWKNSGYHYIINAQGNISQLLPLSHVANGVRGYNRHSVHLAYIGGIDHLGRPCDTRTTDQKRSMLTLVKILSKKYPSAKILGHRDISPDTNHDGKVSPREWIKACPCFDVESWLKDCHFSGV